MEKENPRKKDVVAWKNADKTSVEKRIDAIEKFLGLK